MSIPVRNIWWLMLYASDLGKHASPTNLAAEDLPEDIPDLVAEILARAVELRQRRQLSTAFLPREAVLSRVRGRIDHLTTSRRQLLAKGQVACRFEELSVDSPRNRYVRAALESVARLVRKPELAHRCRGLAHGLRRQGVVGEAPSRQQISQERFGRHDQADEPMLAAARLAMDLALPSEEAGPNALLDPQRCVHWLRRLYEKAIGGFYRLHLDAPHWVVHTGKALSWPIADATSGITQVFPSMRTDIVIDRSDQPKRLVIDTKFTHVYGRGWYRDLSLRSGYVYQLYAYLRSQEGRGDARADRADGLLLHPAINGDVDEAVLIQGHQMRFATVDLAGDHGAIKSRLLELVGGTES
ncbi:5-methylcytosine-specific restriction endonuclease system specificity protein McrC [Vulcanococcus limneticus]|uniref:5-methylcytosine-specific restriction endonuclease system specificity protein McrC n=1 Tax=Vulcanococcus limneticus TaxID=2170428 RepID=UPI00398BEEBF